MHLLGAAQPALIVAPCVGEAGIILHWDASWPDLIPELGALVVNQFTRSAYPLTTQVFEISHEGISAIGDFPSSG
jgi:hypothetical protein